MRKLYAALAIIFLAATLQAADTEDKQKQKNRTSLQHEVSVTANRIETPARETASSVTIITREDLEKTQKITVLAALEDALGLSFSQNGPRGSAASVMIRGANSEHTLILLDGMELNDPISPARSADLAHLTVEAVDRIEILRGPQSLLYGSDALGGVINIITHRGTGRPSLQVSTMAGSQGTASGHARIQGGGQRAFFSLGTSYQQTSGLSAAGKNYPGNTEKDGYRNLSVTGNLGYSPGDNLELSLVFRHFNSRTDIDNFGGPYGDDPNHRQYTRSMMVKGQAKTSLLSHRWEQIFALSLVSSTRETTNPADTFHPFDAETGQYTSRLWKLAWQHNLYLHDRNTLMVGLDLQKEEGESEYLSESQWGPYASLFPRKSAESLGVYIQDQVRLSGRFSATAGLRLNRYKSFGTIFTYRLAPTLFFPETETKLKASFGTGFKAPSLYQLFAPETLWGKIGNTALLPEKSWGWDVGAEQLLFKGNMLLGITYFRNRFKNLIQFDYNLGYTNIGLSHASGMEWNLRARVSPSILLRSGYTRTKTRDVQTGEELLRRPQDKLTVGLELEWGKAFLNLSLNHTGRRLDMDYSVYPSSRTTLKAFTLLNSVASYEISPHIRAFLRMDNILNVRYELVRGYGTPGRSIFAGVTFK
jgi:vitamin B12 transporter